MMRKIVLLLGFLPLLAMAQENGKPFRVSGKFKNMAKSPDWVFLQYRVAGEWKTDSAKANEGKYSFSGMLEEPVTGYLRVRYPVGSDGKRPALVNGRDAATVFLQPGKIKISSVDSFIWNIKSSYWQGSLMTSR